MRAHPRPAGQPVAHPHGDRLHHRARWSLADAIGILESPERRKREDPATVLEFAGIRSGEVVVDLGAGTGYYSAPIARRVGPTGRVLAVDHSPELIEHLRRRRAAEGLVALEPVLSQTESVPLPSGLADVVLLANVLHDLSLPSIREAVRLLGSSGRLIDLDWKRDGRAEGPPAALRMSPGDARRLLRPLGLAAVDEAELGPRQYLLRFERSPAEPAADGPSAASGRLRRRR